MRARISVMRFSLTFPNPIFNADSVKLWAGPTRQQKAEEALLLEIQEPEVSQQSEWIALSGYHITPRSLIWEIIITQHSRKSLFQEKKKKNGQFIINSKRNSAFILTASHLYFRCYRGARTLASCRSVLSETLHISVYFVLILELFCLFAFLPLFLLFQKKPNTIRNSPEAGVSTTAATTLSDNTTTFTTTL